MNTIQQNKIALSILKDRLHDAKHVLENFEIDEADVVEQFEDMMDSDGPVRVWGVKYSPSRIMRELDPSHYRAELERYLDGLDIQLFNEPLREAVEAIEDEIEALKADMESK